MRKLIAMLMALTLVVALAACGGTPASSTPPASSAPAESTAAGNDTPAGETTKLTLILRGGHYPELMEELLADFEAENNVECEILSFAFDELHDKISLDAPNAQGAYDLMMVDSQWFAEFTEYDMLLNLGEAGYTLDDDFMTELAAPGIDANGNAFVVPYWVNINFLFYNTDVLASVDAEVPETWEDVLSVAQAVSATGENGYLLRAQAGDSIMGDFLPIMWAHGGDIFDDAGNVTIDTPEAKAALEFYLQLKETGAIMEKDDIVTSVGEGKAAMSLCWASWFMPGEGGAAQYAVIPGKLNSSSDSYKASIFGSWYLGVPANTQNSEMAIKLLDFLTGAETQLTAVNTPLSIDSVYVPTRHSVYQNADVIAAHPFLQSVYEAIPNGTYRPMVKEWTQITIDFGIELEAAVQGQKTVEQALADAQSVVEQLMGQ